jgi:hypothetical protein
MQTYTTIDHQTLDLSSLSSEERAYLARAYAVYRSGMPFAEFNNTYVTGSANPLLGPTDGWITEAVWHHPLYRALRDLGARLGIAQGSLAPEGDWQSDPISDSWLPASDVAR